MVYSLFNQKNHYLCTAIAQMAESVDALVSNTSGATHPGSTPGLGTEAEKVFQLSPFFIKQLVSLSN